MSIRMRHTSAHSKNRRAHHKLKAPRFTLDKETGSLHLRHRVDMATGMYRGKKIFEPADTVSKKVRKMARSEVHAHAHDHAHGKEQKVKTQAMPRARAQRRTATSASKGG